MRDKHLTETRVLWEAVEALGEERKSTSNVKITFPESFLSGLREALVAGLTCEQIVAFLAITSELHKVLHNFDGQELLDRTDGILRAMEGDLEFLAKQKDIIKRRTEIKEKMNKKRFSYKK